jgi:hypothetical protein
MNKDEIRPLLLEDYTVPICCLRGGTNNIQTHFGTAFFISSNGIFLSARHCIQKELIEKEDLGLIVKDKKMGNVFSKIVDIDYPHGNLDIVAVMINLKPDKIFKFKNNNLHVWRDVATLGYPEDAIDRKKGFWLNLRGHKGYVQRIIRDGKPPSLENNIGRLIELSFQITPGLSGAPLFTYEPSNDVLVGVCIGNHRAEKLLDNILETEENGNIYKEVTKRYDYAGLAQDIRDILDWKPKFSTLTIGEILE